MSDTSSKPGHRTNGGKSLMDAFTLMQLYHRKGNMSSVPSISREDRFAFCRCCWVCLRPSCLWRGTVRLSLKRYCQVVFGEVLSGRLWRGTVRLSSKRYCQVVFGEVLSGCLRRGTVRLSLERYCQVVFGEVLSGCL